MEEDHSDDTLSITSLASLELHGGQGDPDSKGKGHTTTGDQEQRAATNAINHHSPEPGFKHAGHEDEGVDQVLVGSAIVSDGAEDVGEVVSRNTGSGEL